MITPSSGLLDNGIEQILKLSSDAHIARLCTPKDSPEFHNLTGKIRAYGKVLALLTALQKREEFLEVVSDHEFFLSPPQQLAEAPALFHDCF